MLKGIIPYAFADNEPGQNDINQPKIPIRKLKKLTVAIIQSREKMNLDQV